MRPVRVTSVATAQVGIFAVGTSAHCYLEFDRAGQADPRALVAAVVAVDEPHSTVGGVNFVVGVRPELWGQVATARPEVRGFDEPIVGADGFTLPATQHDVWIWIAGAAQDLIFDVAAEVIATLRPVASLASEVSGWSYLHSRDLTGFEDGTENPPLAEAPSVVLSDDGFSVLLVQQWAHDFDAWTALDVEAQERAMGRTKAGSIELDHKPADSHVARTVIVEDGAELDIFRRNAPYGTVSEHGTMFIGFSVDQHRLDRMLRRMAGAEDGVRDALTRYTRPLTGAYYVIPSVEAFADIG